MPKKRDKKRKTVGRDHSGWRAAALAVVLVALTLAVFAPVRHFDFIEMDDPNYVFENPQVLAGLTPESVAAVVTLAGYVLPLGGPPSWVHALLRSRAAVAVAGGVARSRLGRPLVDAALRRAFAPGPVPEGYERVALPLALQPANLAGDGEDRRSAEAGLRTLQPLYPSLAAPLVIVVGEDDRMVPPSTSLRLRALVPGAELVVVPGAGHLPQFTTPGPVLAAVTRAAVLGGVTPRRPDHGDTFASAPTPA